ncbi:transmembrane protein 198-like [Clytia hemisphaerica]|uniref:Transmembrane protein 198 n=2 Tax=Clytia hemisphaerica TaxID=252671 RepID=A0A7M5XKA3_9CNID
MLQSNKLVFVVLMLSNVLHVQTQNYNENYNEPIKESPLNFDIDSKKNAPLPTCEFSYNYDLARGILSAVCFVMAAFILVFGYKRRRISFCLTGLTSTSILAYMVLVVESRFSLMINILISMSIGLFVSLFTTTLLYCGLFITGLFAGFVNGFVFLMIYTTFKPIDSVALGCLIVAVFGLGQVFITMWWKHRMHILSSCIFAAGVMMCSLDYFVEGFFILEYMEMKIFYNRVAELCWWSYLVLALFALFLVIGLLVQCLWSGKEKQKEPYTFVYLTRRRGQSRNRQSYVNPYGHDEHNYLINNS